MQVDDGVQRVLEGEPVDVLARAYRHGLLAAFGLDPREAAAETFARETRLFVNNVCRELGDRHSGDQRALVALRDWAPRCRDYEPWDALLTHFEFDGKDTLVRRGRVLFPGPMTSHWDG